MGIGEPPSRVTEPLALMMGSNLEFTINAHLSGFSNG